MDTVKCDTLRNIAAYYDGCASVTLTSKDPEIRAKGHRQLLISTVLRYIASYEVDIDIVRDTKFQDFIADQIDSSRRFY